jgi:hypothetical protein
MWQDWVLSHNSVLHHKLKLFELSLKWVYSQALALILSNPRDTTFDDSNYMFVVFINAIGKNRSIVCGCSVGYRTDAKVNHFSPSRASLAEFATFYDDSLAATGAPGWVDTPPHPPQHVITSSITTAISLPPPSSLPTTTTEIKSIAAPSTINEVKSSKLSSSDYIIRRAVLADAAALAVSGTDVSLFMFFFLLCFREYLSLICYMLVS